MTNNKKRDEDKKTTRELVSSLKHPAENQNIKTDTTVIDGQKYTMITDYHASKAPFVAILPSLAQRMHVRGGKYVAPIQSVDEAIWFGFYAGALNMITNNSYGTPGLALTKKDKTGATCLDLINVTENEKGQKIINGRALLTDTDAVIMMSLNEICACEFGALWDMGKQRIKHGFADTLARQYDRFVRMIQDGIEPRMRSSFTDKGKQRKLDVTPIHIAAIAQIDDEPAIFEVHIDRRVMPIEINDNKIAFGHRRYIQHDPGLLGILQVGREKLAKKYDGKITLPSAVTAEKVLLVFFAVLQNESISGFTHWLDDADSEIGSYTYLTINDKRILRSFFASYTNGEGRIETENVSNAILNIFAMYNIGIRVAGIPYDAKRLMLSRISISKDTCLLVLKRMYENDFIPNSRSMGHESDTNYQECDDDSQLSLALPANTTLLEQPLETTAKKIISRRDALKQRVLAYKKLNPRASVRLIAAATGIPKSTIARYLAE